MQRRARAVARAALWSGHDSMSSMKGCSRASKLWRQSKFARCKMPQMRRSLYVYNLQSEGSEPAGLLQCRMPLVASCVLRKSHCCSSQGKQPRRPGLTGVLMEKVIRAPCLSQLLRGHKGCAEEGKRADRRSRSSQTGKGEG